MKNLWATRIASVGLGVFAGVLLAGSGDTGAKPHWTYMGKEGPAQWGFLAPDYSMCASGKFQSPIDIKESLKGDLSRLRFNYNPSALNISNNGHTIQVNIEPGSTFESGSDTYQLIQFHFHTPSEHRLLGKQFPMELHLVHKDIKGRLAVVGVMIEAGKPHDAIEVIWNNVPKAGSDKMVNGIAINPMSLLPTTGGYYKYPGSLTTPPCSEGVAWHVLKSPIQFSVEQLHKFSKLYSNNARPIQLLKDRPVEDI